MDELLPVLNKRYNISKNPDDRPCLCRSQSGAICAFTVAWHRPDQFHKVISTIGSFTNIMGGHVYPDLIRKNDRKPIRIFLTRRHERQPGRPPRRQWRLLTPTWELARAKHQNGRGFDRKEV